MNSGEATGLKAGVLFDFDGTLVDTFDDIIEAVQQMRGRLGAGPIPNGQIKRHIGWGAPNLVGQCHPQLDALRPDNLPRDGGPLPVPAGEVERVLQIFRCEYTEVQLQHTHAYSGIKTLCRRLARDGFALAVVSNKPERFIRQILAGLGMVDPFALVLGGDSLSKKKPEPEPLLHAVRELRISAKRCVMVGDSGPDIEAARAAQIPSCAVSWGILPTEDLRALNPTRLVRTVQELEHSLYRNRPAR